MTFIYTPTWEEYAEQFENIWPRPDYFSAIVITMVTLPLIAYGIALEIFGTRGEELLYSMFIGGPFFLAVAAALAVTSQARSAKAKAVAEKRLEYEKWCANEQSFSFDQEKWTHTTEAGRQESPWSALRIAIEHKSAFWLTTEKSSIMICKRVFDPSALTLLRQAALPVRGDGWKFYSRCWDYQAAGTVLLWRKRWFAMAFGNVFALAVLGWIVQTWLAQDAKPVMIWGWILAAFAVVLTLTAQLWYLPLQYLTWPKRWKEPMTLEFSEWGVHFTTANENFFLSWKTLRKSEETGRAFLLYSNPSHYYILAKQYITLDQQDELRRMLQKKLKPA
ncbi:MAG: YcxB family protein [Acidobacteriia bacterium]|nr:YcxB family protein [Terriglobia bacterium]